MPERRRVGGYIFNGEVARARRSTKHIKELVGDINVLAKKRADIMAITTLLVEILLSASEVESALQEIERIASGGEKEGATVG